MAAGTLTESGDRRRSTRLTSKRAMKEDESPSQAKRRKVSLVDDPDFKSLPGTKSVTKGLVPTVVINMAAKPMPEADDQSRVIDTSDKLDTQADMVPLGLDRPSSVAPAMDPAQTLGQKPQRKKNKSKNKEKVSEARVLGEEVREDQENAEEEGLAADGDSVPSALDVMSSTINKPKTKTSAAPAETKASHVRFGSEEPPAAPKSLTIISTKPVADSEDEEDSDDEAPEDVTTSAAQSQAQALAAEQEKAIADQKAETKRKRRNAAERLRSQAESSKSKPARKQKTTAGSDSDDASSDAEKGGTNDLSSAVPTTSSKPDILLPDFLPAELLNRRRTPSPSPEPSSRPANPKNNNNNNNNKVPSSAQPKGRLTKFVDSAQADVRVGPVNVRVLQAANPRLPARGDGKGASVRKAWLAGRVGGGGAAGVQRRKIGNGFLRR